MGCVCSKVKGGDSKKDSNVAYSPVKQRDPNKKEKSKQEGKKYQKLGTTDEHEDGVYAEGQTGEIEDANVSKDGGYSLLVTEHDEDVSLNASDVINSKEEESEDHAQADTSKNVGIVLTDPKENNNAIIDVEVSNPVIPTGEEDKDTDLNRITTDVTGGDSVTEVNITVSTAKDDGKEQNELSSSLAIDAAIASKYVSGDDTAKASESTLGATIDGKHSDVDNVEVKKSDIEVKEANDLANGNELFISEDIDHEVETSQVNVHVIAEGDKSKNVDLDSVTDEKRTEDLNIVGKISTDNENTQKTESISIKDTVTSEDDVETPKSKIPNGSNVEPSLSSQKIGSDHISTDTVDANSNKSDNCITLNNADASDECNEGVDNDVDCAENEPLLVEKEDNTNSEHDMKVNEDQINEQEALESSVTEQETLKLSATEIKSDIPETDQNIDDTDSRSANQSQHLNESAPNNVIHDDTNGEIDDLCEEKEPLLVSNQTVVEETSGSVVGSPDDKKDAIAIEQSSQEQDRAINDQGSEPLSPDDVEMHLPKQDSSLDNHVNGVMADSENRTSIENESLTNHEDIGNNDSSLRFRPQDFGTSNEGSNLTSPNVVNFGDDNLNLQFSPTSVMNDSQFGETELTFEKAKYVIHAAIHYLKTCKNYTSPKACAVMKKLSVASCVISSIKSETRTHLANYLVQTGFAELFVKIARTLHTDGEDTSQIEDSLKVMKGTCTNFSTGNEFESLVCELARHGAIGLLLQELDVYFPTDSDHKLIHVVHTLNILSNCVRCSDGHIRESYRNANAVNILMKYLKSNEIKLKLESLSILAYIVDDKEADLIADVQGLFLCLLDTLKEAVTADDFYVHYNIAGEPCGDGVYGLIDTLNRLVINDSCKRQVVDQDGIPIITQILQIQGADAQDSQLAALEALWKIAFIEKHQQVLIQHILDSNVVPILTEMQASQSSSLRDASTGLLWKLGLVDIQATDDGDDDEELEQIMLSYVKDNFKEAKKLRDILSAAGFKVWMDLQKGDGNFITSMVDALNNSAVVLVCVSLKYRESVHCQTEAIFVQESTKPIIPLLIEEEYKGDGWLAELMSSMKQFNAYSDEALEGDIEELIDELVDCGCI